MGDSKTFRELALSFDDVTETPHFNKSAFKANKKIFATLEEGRDIGMIQLTPVQQSLYCKVDPAIYPVPGGWGSKGSTYVDLKKIKKRLLKELLQIAYHAKFQK